MADRMRSQRQARQRRHDANALLASQPDRPAVLSLVSPHGLAPIRHEQAPAQATATAAGGPQFGYDFAQLPKQADASGAGPAAQQPGQLQRRPTQQPAPDKAARPRANAGKKAQQPSVMSKVKQYDDFIKEASDTYGISVRQIRAIMATESAGNPTATSGAAWGLMQVTKSTWKATQKSHSELKDYDFDDNWDDPHINILFGTAVLKDSMAQMKVRAGSDSTAVLGVMAYNAGAGTIKHAMKLANEAGSKDPEKDCLKPEYLKPAIKRTGIYSYYLTGSGAKRNTHVLEVTKGAKGKAIPTLREDSTMEQAEEAAIELKYQEVSRYPVRAQRFLDDKENQAASSGDPASENGQAAPEKGTGQSAESSAGIWEQFTQIMHTIAEEARQLVSTSTESSHATSPAKPASTQLTAKPATAGEGAKASSQAKKLRDTLEVAKVLETQLRAEHPGYGSKFVGYGHGEDQYVCTTFAQKVLSDAGYTITRKTAGKINIAIDPKKENLAELVEANDARTKGVVTALVDSGQGEEIQIGQLQKGDFVQYWYKKNGALLGHVVQVEEVIKPGNSIKAHGSHGTTNGVATMTVYLTGKNILKVYCVRPKGNLADTRK